MWLSIGLAAITLLVFAPILAFDFVPWDDPLYVTQNAHVLAGLTWRGARWALTTGESFYWHPLTWLTHMLDVEFWGLNAGRHHLVNLVLHVMSTLVLFGTLRRMTGSLGRSAFVAGLFAVHPLHVEPVAWIAERKEVLSGFFSMLTIWSYVSYVRSPALRRYVIVVLCFALGLMAKPMIVTLPFVLLLLDVWPLGRVPLGGASQDPGSGPRRPWSALARLVREKVPLLALGIAASVATFVNQLDAGSVRTLTGFPIDLRLANAALSYVAYVWTAIWPAGLAAFYPYPTALPPWWEITTAVLGLVTVSFYVVWAGRRRPYLPVGWFWYLGTLVPVIGLIQVGDQARADRFTYFPLIGLFLMVAWGVPDLLARWRHRRLLLAAAAGIVILACAAGARAQVMFWKDGFALWERAAAVTTGNQRAYASLGQLLEGQGRIDDAIAKYREACRFTTNPSGLQTRIGTLLAQQGNTAEAAAAFTSAIAAQPDNVLAHYNLALALDAQGRAGEALDHYAAAVRWQPGSAVGRQAFGAALRRQGRTDEAIGELSEAVRLRPDWALARNALALALADKGMLDEAIGQGREAVRLEPDNPEWHSNLSGMFEQRGNTGDAIEHIELALKIDPTHRGAPVWHYNLAALYDRLGNRSLAVAHLQAALALDPQYDAARRALIEMQAAR